MNIQHQSLFDTAQLEEHYSNKDGVPVKYVCTSDLRTSDIPMDIFYRETPHPEFGNYYFGVYKHPVTKDIFITKRGLFIYYEFNIFCEKKHNNQKKKKEIYVSFLTSSTSHSVGEICVIISALLSLLRLS